ncbi:hypothetical protein [Clostridium collagenovorans]|nr:hypothetical protein [Clostridium collagenovorans]
MEIKLNKNIVYRYESKLFGGKTFIFNINDQKILLSDILAFDILRLIENEARSVEEIICTMNEKYKRDISDKIRVFISKMCSNQILIQN